MKGIMRRPTDEFVMFRAVTPELAEKYAIQHDLAIINNPSEISVLPRGNYKDMLYAYGFHKDDPTYFLANRLKPFDTSKGDLL